MARRATFIKQVRGSAENVLALDSGNVLVGVQGLSEQTQGEVIIDALNLMGYTAITLGANDLRLGPTVLRERMAQAEFPIVSANITIAETGKLFADPYAIVEIAGHRLGIIGFTEPVGQLPAVTGESESFTIQEPLEFGLPYLQAALQEADIVIVLSHLGQALDEALAKQVAGLDVIIAGRDGMVLNPARYDSTGPVIAQAGTQGQLVGQLELALNARGQVVAFGGKPVLLTDAYAYDPEMLALLDRYRP